MAWTDNAIMFWSSDGGTTWNKITDHNRSAMSVNVERIENKGRMTDGTLRRYSVGKKRTFQCSWTMLPAKRNTSYNGKTALTTVDNGWAGEEIENFHNTVDGVFKLKLRKGQDEAKAANDGTIETFNVMIADFSKDIEKRGIVDFWSLDITLEEV
jgi:hypothetical protein